MDSSSFDIQDDGLLDFTEIQTLYSNGATSDTFKVRMNGKWYFLKRLKKEYIDHPLYKAAFDKEFEIGSQINHPNIVFYIEKGNDSEGIYILSEYIEGFTLKYFLESYPDYFHKKVNLKKFIQQLLLALEYLHERQILHLDLKPENILITKVDFDVKIVDLGFAYTDVHQYETSGKSMNYAAPEQIENNKDIDQRADIYSLGLLILYAYTSSNNKSLVKKLPEPYRNCTKKCLIEDKDNRFESILSIKEYLAKKRKHKIILYSSLVLFFVLGIIGSMLFFFQKDSNVPIDISDMDVPNDIMEKITFQTSIDYLKANYGEPKESDSTGSMHFYSWHFKNLNLSVFENEKSIESISYKLTGDADLVYDEILSDCGLPNFGIATFGDFFNSYHYDGGFVSWGGKFYVDICFAEACLSEIKIVIGANSITMGRTIVLSSYRTGLLDLDYDIVEKIRDEGIESLNNNQKKRLFEEIKKLRIDNISQSYTDEYWDIDPDDLLAPTPFYIEK